jgi:hypothetical protein
MARYIVQGEMHRPGDAFVETFSLANARSAFADLVAEGAKFATIIECHGPSGIEGREIGRFTSFAA